MLDECYFCLQGCTCTPPKVERRKSKCDESVPWARVRSGRGRKTDIDIDGRLRRKGSSNCRRKRRRIRHKKKKETDEEDDGEEDKEEESECPTLDRLKRLRIPVSTAILKRDFVYFTLFVSFGKDIGCQLLVPSVRDVYVEHRDKCVTCNELLTPETHSMGWTFSILPW